MFLEIFQISLDKTMLKAVHDNNEVPNASTSRQHHVPDKIKEWRPKTQAGRMTKAGLFESYWSVRLSKYPLKEPEIADHFFSQNLIVAPLKIIPIGEGQYRFKAFVAVGDGTTSIGLGERCGKTRKMAEEGAIRNAKLNIMRIKKTWIKPVTGQKGEVLVRLYPHEQLNVRPIIRRILTLCGIVGCKVETNTEKDSSHLVLALFDALEKLDC